MPAAAVFQAPGRRSLEALEEARKEREGHQAEWGRYQPSYALVEPSPPAADFARAKPRDPDTGRPRKLLEGDVLDLSLQRAHEALRTLRGVHVEMDRAVGRAELEPRPPPTAQLSFVHPDTDLPVRRRVLVPDMSRGQGHVVGARTCLPLAHRALLVTAEHRFSRVQLEEAEVDPVDARRGPGFYHWEHLKQVGVDGKAPDFGRQLGECPCSRASNPRAGPQCHLYPRNS